MRKFTRLCVLSLGLGVLPVMAQETPDPDEDGGGFLENLIEDRLSSDGFQVQVRGFEGALSSTARVAQIVISDEEGAWLTVNDAVLDWNRSALLRGRLEVEELAAAEILLPRLPQGEEQADVPQPEAQPFSLPELPVSIQIGQIDAERIELGQTVLGEEAVLSLQGSARLADGEGEVDIRAERLDDEGVFQVAGSFENGSRELTIDVSLEEGPDGIVASLIDLPGRPALSVSVEGSGPLSDFDAEIDLDTDGEDRLSGTVSLDEVDGANRFTVDLGGDVTALFAPTYRPFFGPNVQLQAEGARFPDGAFRLDSLDLSAQSLSLEGQVSIGADGVPDLIDVTGEIASENGPVLLPVGGDIRVGRVGLDVNFDASEGETWTGEIVVENFDQPGIEIARLALDGSGVISGAGETLDIEAGFDIDANGLALDDGGLEAALGEDLTGRVELGYEAGDPIVMSVLRLTGVGFTLNGQGEVDPDGENVPLSLQAQLDADDLSVFSALSGLQLGGGASVDLDLSAEALSGAFDLTLDGRTQDLSLGIDQVDPLLTGSTLLQLEADRDETGLRVSDLSLQNEAIDVDGSADLTSDGGTAELEARIDDLNRIDPSLSGPATLTASARRPADEWRIDLSFEGAEAAVAGDATIRELDAESPLAIFDLGVVADDLSNFGVILGRPLAGSVDLSARGQSRLNLRQADVALSGSMTDIEIGQDEVDRLLSGETQIEAQVQREGPQFTVPGLRVENPQIAVNGDAFIASGQSEVDLRIALDELSQIVPEMQGPADIVLDAVEDQEGWIVDLDATGAGSRIVADATVTDLRADDASPLVEGTAQVSVDDLSVFSSLADRELGGTVDLDLAGRSRFNLSEAEIATTGQTRNLAVGQPELDRLFEGVTDLAITAEKNDETIFVERLSLENPQVRVGGEGTYGGAGQNAVDAAILFTELSDVVPQMSGRAEITLDAEEVDDAWQIDLEGDGAGALIDLAGQITGLDDVPAFDGAASIEVADLSVFSTLANRDLGGAVDLEAEGMARFDLSEARIDATGQTRDLAIDQAEFDRLFRGVTQLSVDGAKDADRLSLDELILRNSQINATAQGTYGGDGANAVQADISVAQLSDILPELSGPADVTLVAEETGDVWQVSLDGDGAGAVVDVLGEVGGLGATPRFDGEATVRAADLSRFSRIAGRPLAGSVNLSANGSATLDASRFDLTADLRANGLRTGIAQADQLLAGGTTTLQASAVRTGPNAPIRVRTFNLNAPGLDATANGSILGGASDLTFNARLANLGQFVPNLNGPLTAQGRAGQQGSNISLDVALTGPEGIQAQVDGTVAQSFDRANIDVAGNAPLRIANPFLGNRALTGTARFDLGLNGPLQPSSASGTITVEGGRLVDPSVPFVLNDINGTAQLQGSQAVLNVTANKQEGGALRLAGTIGLTPGYAADLGIELNQLVIEDPRLYRTTANGRVTLNGSLAGGATIGGTIILGETEIRVPSTGLGATGPIPDGLVHVNEPADVRRTRVKADLIEDDADGSGGGGVAFPLDLTIVADNQVFIRGRGLDAELGGRLELQGTTQDVIPIGQFDLIRGRLDILGQRIMLTEGSATLAGDFVPRIRLVARTEADDVTVLIILEGEATEPDIRFSSEPELPQDEVLARLLFGRSIDQISPLQAAQLANAVATLSGRGGIGIISSLRDNTGLDDLDLTTDEDGNVGVRAGAYISENLYTDVTVDSEGDAEINLNLDLTDSITVRGGASNSGETSLGVFFERDY